MHNVAILGSGIYLPQREISNENLERSLGLEPGSIEAKTGIRTRRWATTNETVEYMAAQAALEACQDANITQIKHIMMVRDVILTRRAYSIALPVIDKLAAAGIEVQDAFSIDICNYCPGMIHGINMASLMVSQGQAENVLVIASTNYVDMIELDPEFNQNFGESFVRNDGVQQFSVESDRFQAPRLNAFLWGSGAGALVVGRSSCQGILGYLGMGSQQFRREAYGIGESARGSGFAALDGKAIYRFAVTEVAEFLKRFCGQCGLPLSEVDFLIPHQPNPRILRELTQRLNMPAEKVLISCDYLGNMIGASVPVTYHLARGNGTISKGHKVILCSFGDSYLVAAALLIEEQ